MSVNELLPIPFISELRYNLPLGTIQQQQERVPFNLVSPTFGTGIPLPYSNPYKTQQRKMIGVYLPVIMAVLAPTFTHVTTEAELIDPTIDFNLDILIGKQNLATINTQLEFLGSVNFPAGNQLLWHTGTVYAQFQNPVIMPSAATIEVGGHGVWPNFPNYVVELKSLVAYLGMKSQNIGNFKGVQPVLENSPGSITFEDEPIDFGFDPIAIR